MLVADFEIIIMKTFAAALLMLSPFGFYGDILELVYALFILRHRVAPL